MQFGYVKKDKLVNISKERSSLELSSEDFSKFDLEKDTIIEITDEIYPDFNTRISNYDSRTQLIGELTGKIKTEITKDSNYEKNIGIKMNISNIENTDNYYKFLRELKAYMNSNGCFLIVSKKDSLDNKILSKVANIVAGD